MQQVFPRFHRDTLLPIAESANPNDHLFDSRDWYPPGHGEVFETLLASSEVRTLLELENRDILYLSNGDNLGAAVLPDILFDYRFFYFREECLYRFLCFR